MKRIHLFEFEDLAWFPDWLRRALTRLIVVMHKVLKSDEQLTELLAPLIRETKSDKIIDLCSGSGGPMPDVVKSLNKDGFENLSLTLTDLYPNKKVAESINVLENNITYKTEPVDAANPSNSLVGLRTMISSFHHMKPEIAKQILISAFQSRQPICIFEISDNSYPKFLWWATIPINILTCLIVTPMVRPMTWQQLIFTYLIPIIPLFFAWDGAVSNARTYTIKDLDILLEDLRSSDYHWESGTIKGRGNKLYLLGKPV